jgi:hypothetical protein
MGLQVYVVTNDRIAGINRKISWENVNPHRKDDERLQFCLYVQHSWPPDDRIFVFALFMVSSNLNLLT